MPNYSIFNRSNGPLYTQQVNTFSAPGIDSSPEGGAAMSGILFSANFSSSITAAQDAILQVSNPANSGKTMYVSRIAGSSSISGTTVNVLKNATVAGSAVTPVNLNFGSTTASVMTVQSLAGTMGGTPVTILTLILAAGSFVLELGGRIVVPPGN
ncbi:hypothetical protein [Paenibacillus tyrfis]|nr:hypothetical protein [Paenibacillus tyrfis]